MAKIDRSKYRLSIDQYSVHKRRGSGRIGVVTFDRAECGWHAYVDMGESLRFLRTDGSLQPGMGPAKYQTHDDAAAALIAHHERP